MWKKFKDWLYKRFLPEACRNDLIRANVALLKDNERLTNENAVLRAYIRGMELAMRRQRRVIITTNGEVQRP